MKQLPVQFNRDNCLFVQVKRSDKAAIYARKSEDGAKILNYEVFALKSKDGEEVYPGQTAFGVWAWSPMTEDRVNAYFARINSGETVIPDVDPVTGEVNHGPDIALDDMPDVNEDPNTPRPVPLLTPLIAETPVSLVEETAVAGSAVPVGWDVVDPAPVTPKVEPTPDGGAVVEVAKVKRGRVAASITIPEGEFTKVKFAEVNGLQEGNAYVRLQKEIEAGNVKLVRSEKLTAGRGRPTAIYAKA